MRAVYEYHPGMRIPRALGFTTVILAVTLFASACGSSGGSPASGASGVDGSKKLIDLTDAEKGMVCDWMVPRVGSYGDPGTCDLTLPAPMSPFLVYVDQAACIADSVGPSRPGCQATVAQLEACIETLPACATSTDVTNSSACAPLSSC
jgi:hypothetical protein